MKVSIEYKVSYDYAELVTENDNILRVFPSTEFWQKPINDEITLTPKGRIIYFTDRFGNKNARIKITQPHKHTCFQVISTVEINSYKVVKSGNFNLPLDRTMLPADVIDFLNPSTLVNPEMILHNAPHVVNGIKTIEEALVFLTEWTTKKIQYAPKSTTIHTKAREALALGAGVCQDKSYILIGFLRSLGIPARYVSGVLVDTPGDHMLGLRHIGQK